MGKGRAADPGDRDQAGARGKNAALAGKPVDLVLAMLAAYPKLGKSLFPRNTWRNSLVGDEFTDIGQELLTALLASRGPSPVTALSDLAYDVIADRYLLGELTDQQHDSLRRMVSVDVAIAMSALHVLGVVVLNRDRDHDADEDSAELTDLGRYAIRRSAAWRSLGTRCFRCASRLRTWTARRCGGR